LSVVYGREIDGKEVTFGTTGYTMNNVFVLYDRATNSIWYPLSETSLEATSGAHQGLAIPFINKPAPTTLREWHIRHPDSKVMLQAAH